MRNYKKYRSPILNLFAEFLAGKQTETELKNNLYKIEIELGNVNTTKDVWFKFFKGDTGATTINELYIDLSLNGGNGELMRRCMQMAIDNPKEFQVYYS